MINTMNPGAVGPKDQKGDVLRKISEQYGKADEKPREATKTLGKDEFFKLMVTQMQHQDPTKPKDHEQMAAEMAQFSALEQMQNMNKNIEKLAMAQAPMQQLGAASLIGKFVTADGSRLIHTEGKPEKLKFELPEDAGTVRVALVNEKGESVKEIDAGERQKGAVEIDWNGRDNKNMNAGGGTYVMQVFAESKQGKPLSIKMQKTEMVTGVGFEGKETVLLIGDPKNQHKMLLKNVSKIVDTNVDPSKAAGGGAGAGAGAGAVAGGADNPFAAMLQAQGVKPEDLAAEMQQAAEEGGEAAAFAGSPQMQDALRQLQQGAQAQPRAGVAGRANPYELEEPGQMSPDKFQPGQASRIVPFEVRGEAAPKVARDKDINPAAEKFSALAKQNGGKVDLREIPESEGGAQTEMSVNPAARARMGGGGGASPAESSTAGNLLE